VLQSILSRGASIRPTTATITGALGYSDIDRTIDRTLAAIKGIEGKRLMYPGSKSRLPRT
jgi:hypothetical protein